MNLYNHQQELIDLNPQKHLLAHECGTGKTLTAIKLAEINATSVLVICPKSIKEQWAREIKKFKEVDDIVWRVVSKEEFKKNAKEFPAVDCIIADEFHYFSSTTSQMHKALYAYIKKHKIEFVYGLTATPYMSTAWNIFALARLLGHEWSYPEFRDRYFYMIPMGHRKIPKQKTGIESEIKEMINNIGNTVAMKDCVDLPESIYQQEYFDLTPEQVQAIDSLEDTVPIVRWTKVHQICSGSLKGDEYTKNQFFKSEKLDRLLEIATEHKKLVVVCRYNNEIEMLAKELRKKYNVVCITGKTKNRDKMVTVANNLEECIVLVNAACSCGYELPTFPTMVFYSYDFSLVNAVQMQGRIQRIDHLQHCIYISLIVRNSIDEDVYKCIQKKEDFNIEIYKLNKK